MVQQTLFEKRSSAKPKRIYIPPQVSPGNANILPSHPAQRASWIWTPNRSSRETAVVDFSLSFDWHSSNPLRFHISADQRFQLSIDGEEISYGPDRCDVLHWAVTTLEISLLPGTHEFNVRCWYIAESAMSSRLDPKHANGNLNAPNPPMAQMSYQAGFLLAGDSDLPPSLLDTGHANWQCTDRTNAVRLTGPKNHGYHDIGPEFHFNMSRWHKAETLKAKAVVVKKPPVFNKHGIRDVGWVPVSTPLPEQKRETVCCGKMRAARTASNSEAVWSENPGVATEPWQRLIDDGKSVDIGPRTEIELIWDFEKYLCGYPLIVWSEGEGSSIEWSWAESMFETDEDQIVDAESPKGHRSKIDGKRWHGFGDSYQASGRVAEKSPALWWRSGRYVRLRISTREAALRINRLQVLTTGYPLQRDFSWKSSDSEWDQIVPLLATGLEAGAHEVWADSPYYEQMMYVGDNVLHALSNYTCYHDDRLSRRTIELLDWSRGDSRAGLIAERYPAAWRQEAVTFASLYPSLIKNFLLWRGDSKFVSMHLSGLRQLMESLIALIDTSGLVTDAPGWPFIDWVADWDQGCGPGVREGDSSIVNLHFVLSLDAAAWIESQIGDSLIEQRYRQISEQMFSCIVDKYWDRKRAILLDTSDLSAPTSQHAQVLALLTNRLDSEKSKACVRAILSEKLDAKCTIYFSFYLLESLYRNGCDDAFFRSLKFWKDLPSKGFCSLPEMPDPCRSDSHGWGAHPLFHSFASIAGIRPSSIGFETVTIRPMLGDWSHLEGHCVHPKGKITFSFTKGSETNTIEISLPKDVTGELHWNNSSFKLNSGTQKLFISTNSKV